MIDAVCDVRSVTGASATLCDALRRTVDRKGTLYDSVESESTSLRTGARDKRIRFADPEGQTAAPCTLFTPHSHNFRTSVPLLSLELASDGDRVFQLHHRCRRPSQNSIYGGK